MKDKYLQKMKKWIGIQRSHLDVKCPICNSDRFNWIMLSDWTLLVKCDKCKRSWPHEKRGKNFTVHGLDHNMISGIKAWKQLQTSVFFK